MSISRHKVESGYGTALPVRLLYEGAEKSQAAFVKRLPDPERAAPKGGVSVGGWEILKNM